MLPEQLLGLGSKALRLFRVFGKLEFIRRLHDFLMHGGRHSRAQTLEMTAKAVYEMEKAEGLRIKNSRALLELMVAAGFSEEKIQATLSDPQEMQRVSAALTIMLSYVDKGIVSIEVVTEKDPPGHAYSGILRRAATKTLSLSQKENRKRAVRKRNKR